MKRNDLVIIIKRRMPPLLKELLSQFTLRAKRYIVASQLVRLEKNPKITVDGKLCYPIQAHIMSDHRGEICNFQMRLKGHQDMSARDWFNKDVLLLEVGDDQYMLMNYPELRVRPFPGERFWVNFMAESAQLGKLNYVPKGK